MRKRERSGSGGGARGDMDGHNEGAGLCPVVDMASFGWIPGLKACIDSSIRVCSMDMAQSYFYLT